MFNTQLNFNGTGRNMRCKFLFSSGIALFKDLILLIIYFILEQVEMIELVVCCNLVCVACKCSVIQYSDNQDFRRYLYL